MMETGATAAAELLARIASREARCAVVGLGYIGSIVSDALVNSGFRVNGFDRSPAAVDRFRRWMKERNPDATGTWSAGSDPGLLDEAEGVVLAVRVLPRDGHAVDLEPLENCAELLRARGREPRLVLVASTVPAGTTRCFADSLGTRPGLFVAHSPERLSVGHDRARLRAIPHLVGPMDAAAGRVAVALLSTICDSVVELSCPEASELSKLLENAFLTTGIALSNEITRIAHRLGVSATEVCGAAASKPHGYYPFFPGPGMGGHCLANDLAILRSTACRGGRVSPFLDAVAQTAATGPELVLRRLESILRQRGLATRNLSVLLVGVGFKPGTSDTTGSPARDLARMLREQGAVLSYLDSRVPEFTVDGAPIHRADAAAIGTARFGAVVVVSGDAAAPLDRLAASSDLLLDTRGREAGSRPPGVWVL